MKNNFRRSNIKRTCDKHYEDYHSYAPYLKKDFDNRCTYCATWDTLIEPLSFQIDHFIPENTFKKAERRDLKNNYYNLMYACPICNRLKSNQFKGEISGDIISNELFYNPDITNYNEIFYRDEKGRIMSDDILGKDMIKRLQLYRPTRQLAWFLEQLILVQNDIEARRLKETNPEKLKILEAADEKIQAALYKRMRFFVHNYYSKDTILSQD